MKLAVFVCLLVSFQVVAGSCINKTVEVLVADGVGLTGDFIGKPDPYVVVSVAVSFILKYNRRYLLVIFLVFLVRASYIIFIVNLMIIGLARKSS